MKNIEPKIFKPYDIRGIYPEEINEETVELIGRALIIFLRKKEKKEKLKIVLSRDNRISSFSLYRALKRGILEERGKVINIGLSSTPMFYFSVWKFGYDGGVQITASHLSPQYNGCKIVGRDAVLIAGESGLEEIKKIVFELKNKKRSKKPKFLSKLNFQKNKNKQFLEEYIKLNLEEVEIKKIKDLKIAIDTGNAVSGSLIRKFKKFLPIRIYHLFPCLKGKFPNHLPDPLKEENLKDLKKIVLDKKLDLGVALDGDGDRIVFIDEKGETILPDFISCLIIETLFHENIKEKIIYTVCSSNVIRDVAKKNNILAIPWRVGHSYIKDKMRGEGAVFGCEYSGHYFLSKYHFSETPLVILLKVLEKIAQEKKPISEIISKYKRYFYSGAINLEVRDKNEKIKELEKKYKGEKISFIDGLRVDFPDYWFSVRPSNTENILRLMIEAKTELLLKKKKEELKMIIKNPA